MIGETLGTAGKRRGIPPRPLDALHILLPFLPLPSRHREDVSYLAATRNDNLLQPRIVHPHTVLQQIGHGDDEVDPLSPFHTKWQLCAVCVKGEAGIRGGKVQVISDRVMVENSEFDFEECGLRGKGELNAEECRAEEGGGLGQGNEGGRGEVVDVRAGGGIEAFSDAGRGLEGEKAWGGRERGKGRGKRRWRDKGRAGERDGWGARWSCRCF